MLGRWVLRGLGPMACGALLAACSSEPLPTQQGKVLSVPETETWFLPGLKRSAYVVRTEANIPHIYADNRADLAYVQGFTIARDRYFMMDLQRRLGLGRITELLGDAALANDQESRGVGMAYLAQRINDNLTPELLVLFESFAAGINHYITQVKLGELPPPSELTLAQTLLGVSQPGEVMEPFTRLDVAGMVSVVLYQTSYETGDVGRANTAASLSTLFEGAPYQDLRRAGADKDLWQRIEPIKPYSSAAGLGLETADPALANSTTRNFAASVTTTPTSLLDRVATRFERSSWQKVRDYDAGFGSNAWAVMGTHSTDGAALLAGDGHLSLSVPSILYNIGLDTSVFGRGDTHQLGLVIAGFPVMAIGTNGNVAWSQTQLMGDVTDWYSEQIQLDSDGTPARALFQGEWRDLEKTEESYVIAEVEVLESKGRTETWDRWVTFDGRWIADIEGRPATDEDPPVEGEAIVNMQGDYIIPGDINDDGVVTAISFDYAALDVTSLLGATDAFGHSRDVHDFREATKGLVAYSQNFAVADSSGSILYTSYQSVPCRGYLERDDDGVWAEGSDPNLLLDGTRYGGFTIPVVDGIVDESDDDPYRCVVPWAETPQALNPSAGFVGTANNDPGNLSTDGSLTNDKWYIGGPWDTGFRADTIARALETAIADNSADVAKMSEIQGNTISPMGALFADAFVASIDYAEALSVPTGDADQRVEGLYQGNRDAINEVRDRINAWRDGGFRTPSGVETFYNTPSDQDRIDAVATTLFNAWFGRVVRGVFDDEGLPGVFHPSGTHGRVRGLNRFLDGRGADNPEGLASFNAETSESIFFDVLGTPEVETSHEIILVALLESLEFLRGDPVEDGIGEGGFGTDDMSQWLWGLRHYVRFESLLGDFIGDDPDYAPLTENFAISTKQLPLELGMPSSDPRAALKWFPRDGDQFCVDASNSGTNGQSFSYGSGPVMRMVVALHGNDVRGVNIIPGGQSALTNSEFFSDQAELWLANETLPMRFSVDDVVAGATGRETFRPAKQKQ